MVKNISVTGNVAKHGDAGIRNATPKAILAVSLRETICTRQSAYHFILAIKARSSQAEPIKLLLFSINTLLKL